MTSYSTQGFANKLRPARIALTALSLGISLLHSGGASAADDYLFAGIGMSSCGEWLSKKSDSGYNMAVISWAQGFLSGKNMVLGERKRERGIPHNGAIEFYLERYCRDKPLAEVIRGADQLFSELPLRSR